MTDATATAAAAATAAATHSKGLDYGTVGGRRYSIFLGYNCSFAKKKRMWFCLVWGNNTISNIF